MITTTTTTTEHGYEKRSVSILLPLFMFMFMFVIMLTLILMLSGCSTTSPIKTPPNRVAIWGMYDGVLWYQGNGIVWRRDSGRTWVVTAFHVLGTDQSPNFEILATDESNDLAIIAIPGLLPGEIELAECPPDGTLVRCWTMHQGKDAVMTGHVANRHLGILDLDVLGGMSGGAVTDDRNRVIGIIVGGWGGGKLSHMIHSRHVRELMRTLR